MLAELDNYNKDPIETPDECLERHGFRVSKSFACRSHAEKLFGALRSISHGRLRCLLCSKRLARMSFSTLGLSLDISDAAAFSFVLLFRYENVSKSVWRQLLKQFARNR